MSLVLPVSSNHRQHRQHTENVYRPPKRVYLLCSVYLVYLVEPD